VIEESPSPFIWPETRSSMTTLAAKAAREIGYTNAGTMEFLVDADQKFYFLEMNTRLQVEHPVTEFVTGFDLVKEQIRIASGKALSCSQSEIIFRGAAVECRIYAEDPEMNFLPSPGKITGLRVPSGPGIRDDSGIYEGFEVPVYYDPLLSKLVAWGRTRAECIHRMRRALEEYQVLGIKTTIPFYQRVMTDPVFLSGNFTTSYIDDVFAQRDRKRQHPLLDVAIIAAAIAEYDSVSTPITTPKQISPWKLLGRKEGLRE
jgi:acetyl-CoA carboxylase, biotin carboxylase subunit